MTGVGEPLVNESYSLSPPADDEAVVEVSGCGVCHTDLGFYYDAVPTRHDLPLTLGHEISGRVTDAGQKATGLTGKSVIVPAIIPCGECDVCLRGMGNICRSQKMPGNDIHGGFASHVKVPARGLCEIDETLLANSEVSLPELSVIADAVTTPYQAAMLAGLGSDDLAIVIGVGGIGVYAVQIAHALGATVVAVDIDQAKLDRLTQYGAAFTCNAAEIDGRELKKRIGGFAKEHDLRTTEWKIFECSGTAAGQLSAFNLLTFGAHLAVVGYTMAKAELRLSNIMAFHARVQGNWGCLPEYYPQVLELVLANRIQMKPFIKQYPLDQINEVFEAAHNHQLSERAILIP